MSWLSDRVCSAVLVMAAVGSAQAQQFMGSTGLTGGFVPDAATKALRIVIGVPGSALLGDPVGRNLEATWPAPQQSRAVVVQDSKTFICSSSSCSADDAVPLLASPARVAWNPAGTMAVLYSSANKSLQFVTITDKQVQADSPVAIETTDDVTAIALSRSGHAALATVSGILGLDRDGTPNWSLPVSGAKTLAFSADESYVYAVVPGALLELSPAAKSVRPIIEGVDFSTIGVSQGKIIAGFSQEPKIGIYTAEGKLTEEVNLERIPSVFRQISGSPVFLLNEPEGERSPAIVLDLTSTTSVKFIPAPAPNAL